MGIPFEGWIALLIWFAVIILPWTYSLYFIYRINKSGVERWGAKPRNINYSGLNKEEGEKLLMGILLGLRFFIF